MKFKKVIILGLAIIFALAALVLISLITRKKDEIQGLQTQKILVTPKALQPGDVISLNALIWKDWPVHSIIMPYIKENDKKEREEIEGSVVRYPIFEGEPVTLNNVIKTGGKSILSAIIRPGMRAVSIPFAKMVNAPALILPGDVIDVVIPQREEIKGHEQDFIGHTIIRNVRVLAVDNSIQKTGDEAAALAPKSLTLEVTSDQAEDLAAAIPDGKIVISMRSVFSGRDVLSHGDRKTDESPEAPAANPARTISIFRGSERSEVTVK